jgi:hypothetical protein
MTAAVFAADGDKGSAASMALLSNPGPTTSDEVCEKADATPDKPESAKREPRQSPPERVFGSSNTN